MKPIVDPEIFPFKTKFLDSKMVLRKRTEVVFMMVNEPDTNQIARRKIMDECFLKFTMN